ncbi:MAG: M1 family peptidase, partial [Chloroflexota bacterium]
MPDASSNPHRLPSFVVPSHYRISLEPDLEKFTFSGTVEIEVEIGQSTDNIQINSADLEISSAWVQDGVGSKIEASNVEHDEDMERATISFGSDLPAGPYTLNAVFTGILNDQLHGYYRS